HEHHSLLNREHHITLLDAFGALTDLIGEYREKQEALLQIRKNLARIDREAEDRERRIDFLRYQIDEIETVAPVSGEEEALTGELSILANAERIRRLGDEAYALLYDAEDALTDRLGQVLKRLQELGSLDGRAEPMAVQGEEIKYVLEDLSQSLRDHVSTIESNPDRLAQVEERLQQLQGLKKKYGPDMAAVLEFRDEAARELERLTGSEADRSRLAQEDERATIELVRLAAQLSEKRKKSAGKMETRVEQELADLLMGGTRFVVQMTQHPPGPGRIAAPGGQALSWNGAEQVEFLVAPNAGEGPKPLVRIASGGELSRIMLAIKTALVGVDPVETLIFDEIDSGVGGGVAEILGRRLRSVAEGRQVICVTHLPQVASQGATHIHIAKETSRKRPRVVARPLAGDDRVQEIARMLGGVKITRTTVEHAAEMLELSG
ncbi:MAG: DNA repair protein RecN, partial [bacterium]|nr:DNA repair protein RecN [bacterium]